MRRRHPIPSVWLMTDPRMGEGLFDALRRLPRGAGVVFRHYDVPNRMDVFARVRRIARRRRLVLLTGGGSLPGTKGGHNARALVGLTSRAVHTRREMIAAVRADVDVVFVSPVFATRSHPGARPLGVVGVTRIIRGTTVPVIGLGGMNARRHRGLRRIGIHGWAGIDAWLSPEMR